MKLSELLHLCEYKGQLTVPETSGMEEVRITGIAYDSRQVQQGNLYVALQGLSADGHDFIPQAIRNGASAVCGSRSLERLPVPYLRVEDSRMALAWLSAAFHGYPGKKLKVIGVTGTDGKTTTSNYIYQILQTAGISAGMITTVSAKIREKEIDTGFHVTTPESPQIQALLGQMVGCEEPISHVVLETTSHGLAQKRVTACFYDIGVFTNITHEHLDYHSSYEEYRATKASLIDEVSFYSCKNENKLIVLNRDDESYPYLYDYTRNKNNVEVCSYGINSMADIVAEKLESGRGRSRYRIRSKAREWVISLGLPGEYNIYNAMAAWCATVEGMNISPEAAIEGIATVTYIPGRMEAIELGQKFMAIVDFAHTPNAIRKALESARAMTEGQVIAVFGSAGLRDREKRWKMAEIAVKLADISILTAEDPRTEDLSKILIEMKEGAEKGGGVEGKSYLIIPDRREAIREAVRLAHPRDLVILCGKGHEQSMCFGSVEYPWDDRVALRSAISEYLGIPGPAMPFLPDYRR